MGYILRHEPSLEPPEPEGRPYAGCACCSETIYEGEDALNLPGIGYICMWCVDEYKVSEVGC